MAAAAIRCPTLVLFTGSTSVGLRLCQCGDAGRSTARATARSISTSPSIDELRDRFHAPGDFAQAYVIAHEVGHHVQNLLGILPKVNAEQRQAGKTRGQRASGAHRAAGRLLRRRVGAQRPTRRASSMSAISTRRSTPPRRSATTRCRSESQGYVVPDSFTHGTAGAAQPLVQARLHQRHDRFLRHLLGQQHLTCRSPAPAVRRIPGTRALPDYVNLTAKQSAARSRRR